MIKLKWHNTLPEVMSALDLAVKADIQWNLSEVKHPSMVIFHHVFLNKNYNGPCVFVWGDEKDDYFHCEYVETPEWKHA